MAAQDCLPNPPQYKALSERLEALKARHEQGLLNSVEFLKQLLALAEDVVRIEKGTQRGGTRPPISGKRS